MTDVPSPFFQVGIIVQDLDAARDELGRALGVSWGTTVENEVDSHPIRLCFTREGPPYLELIEGPPGSPWDASGGPRIDHVGYWTPDIDRAREGLAAEGAAVEVDGGFFAYLRAPQSGLRIELIVDSGRADFYRVFGLDDPTGA